MRTSIPSIPRGRGLARAFTLAEAMISVVVGAAMLPALYSSFTFGYGAVKLAREDLRATQILLQRMETLTLTSFSSIQNGTMTQYSDPSGATNGSSWAVYTITIPRNASTATA